MFRRTLLLGTTALGGCTQIQSIFGTTPAAWADKASTIANGIANVVGQVGSLIGISPSVISAAQSALKSAADFAAQLAGITDPNNAASLLTKIAAGLATAGSLLTGIGGVPAIILESISAAQFLLPIIQSLIGPPAAGALPPQALAPNGMTVDRAMLLLKGAAARR